MRVYDLFCGAGGASTGLRALGIKSIGIDKWELACKSHQANGHTTICADIETFPWHGSCDLLWGSPPCQPFSAGGKQLGSEDERDGMPAFQRAILELSPPVLFMENVKGLASKVNAWYLHDFCRFLRGLGYEYDWKVLNAADYGVPQTRMRVFLVARRDGKKIRWPEQTHFEEPGLLDGEKWVSMGDALGWNGKVGFPRKDDTGTSEDGYRERDWWETDGPSPIVTGKTRSWVRLNTGKDWKPGGTRADAQTIEADRPAPTVSSSGGGAGIWWKERPATTVSGDARINPPGHRINADDIASGRVQRTRSTYSDRAGTEAERVTVVEAATLQGFPAGYVFVGSQTAQFMQIGNAVPPIMAQLLVGANL